MSETQRISDQLKRSLDGEAWHGPAVFEILEGVTAEQAAARPIKNAHNIWELVGHMSIWVEIALARFQGEKPPEPTEDENFPPAPDQPTDKDWQAVQDRLHRCHEAWYAELKQMDDNILHKPRGENLPGIGFVLYGIAQHNAYHGGQIVYLKKAL
jgi:uncharacterized damage-inducible protein DinB